MTSEDTKILDFNQYQKSDKASFIIYADRECLIEKIDGCKNNPEISSTTKISEHIQSGFSMSTMLSLKNIENKHDVHRGKDCMKKFREPLREHAMKIINFKKKKLKLLTKEQQESYWNAEICYAFKEKFENKYLKDKKYRKVKDRCHYTGEYKSAANSICNLKYSVSKRILIFFHNASNYDYRFIMKELAEEFRKQFTYLGGNTEKYRAFTVLIEKDVTRIDKNGEEITKIYLPYYSLLTAQDLWQAHYQILSIIFLKKFIALNVNLDKMKKKCETCGIKYKHCDCFL